MLYVIFANDSLLAFYFILILDSRNDVRQKANSGGFLNLSSKWVIKQWRQLATSTTYLARELLWMSSAVVAQKVFAKETGALKTRRAVASRQKRQRPTGSSPRSWSFYKLHKLPKDSTLTVLWSYGIWSKLESWKSLVSGCLMSWLQIKIVISKSHLLFYATRNHFLIRLWRGMKSGFYMTTGNDQLSWTEKQLQSTSQSQTCTKKVMVTVWWPTDHLIHYSFLNPGETSTSEKMLSKLMRCIENCILQPALVNRKGPTLLHDSAQPYIAQPTLQKLNKLDYKVLPHLPYSPNLSTTNYYFFKHLNNFLQGKCFHNQQEGENAFQEFVQSWSTDLYATGINKLFLVGKSVLIVMVTILINKDVFEPSYNFLKFKVWNELLLYHPNNSKDIKFY